MISRASHGAARLVLIGPRTGIGAGTPARISDLIECGTSCPAVLVHNAFTNSFLGSLKLDELERIVIDGSHIDQKQRGIFDMKETHFPLLQLLTRPELRDRYGASKKRVQILIF